MSLALAATIGGSIVVAGLAAVLAHHFTSRRDLANRRAELRTRYLLDAYRVIADTIHRDLNRSAEDARAFERGLADIQLLGSDAQATMAAGLGQAITAQGEADPAPLLRSLRDDLRQELSLEPLAGDPLHVRVVSRKTSP